MADRCAISSSRVESDPAPLPGGSLPETRPQRDTRLSATQRLGALWVTLLLSLCASAAVGPWTPIFKGVDYSVSTNVPGQDTFPRLQVVHAFRVDLTDPEVRLVTTPPLSNSVPGVSEVGGQTTSGFLTNQHVQVALNANFFEPGAYYLPAGTPMNVFGLAVSDGVVVSPQDGPAYAVCLLFDSNKTATIVPSNWPPTALNGVANAVTGNRLLLAGGTNQETQQSSPDVEPRTAFGVSQDGRYLYLMGVDGRQPGYSSGANYYETAAWLQRLGAHDGIAMDGGGSTLLVMQDSTGAPVRLSQSSAVADSGNERTVASHLGVYAKPVRGFINDVAAVPDDVTARITWTTLEPASTEVEYGPTLDFGSRMEVQSELVTNHQAIVTGLSPWTGYYYRVASATATERYVSSNLFLFTTNYVATTPVFEITNSWRFSPGNSVPAGSGWTALDYPDTAWSGPGPGLLWIAASPNQQVAPRNTELPGDPFNPGFPYVTYYFRTHFELAQVPPGGVLEFIASVDDGAVFHLNGSEIYRLRMPDTWDASTLAVGYPCAGNATTDCLDTFRLSMAALTNLQAGDNVLAVEVHNFNTRSPDITFGLALNRIEPLPRNTRLEVDRSGELIVLRWSDPGAVLQSAPLPAGAWDDVAGGPASPFSVQPAGAERYYRLRR